jgi:glyoxylase-like metal-dependent hydrolase (beta-lactamase superfamily II)
MQPQWFSASAQAKVQWIDGDHDVFGDGRVRILHAPGHTPGSAVLLLRLRKTGAVLLSGDLYLSDEARRKQLVPTINASRADTLASMARIERIAKNLHARVIVQHDPAGFAKLPQAPAFLD